MIGVAESVPSLGARIKQYRLMANLTQEQLATRSGINVSKISRWERDQTEKVDFYDLQQVAKALGIDVLVLSQDDGSIVDLAPPADPPDQEHPTIEGIQVNLKKIGELAPEELDVVARVVQAIMEDAERKRRDQRRKERQDRDARRREPGSPGQSREEDS